VQVIGKARGAGSFLLPGSYEISGQRSTAAISLHQQRCSYVRAHQRRRAGLLGGNADASPVAEQDADLHFECGEPISPLTCPCCCKYHPNSTCAAFDVYCSTFFEG